MTITPSRARITTLKDSLAYQARNLDRHNQGSRCERILFHTGHEVKASAHCTMNGGGERAKALEVTVAFHPLKDLTIVTVEHRNRFQTRLHHSR